MVLNTILFFLLTAMGLYLLTMGLHGLLGLAKRKTQPDYTWKCALWWTLVGGLSCLVAVFITAPNGIADGTMLVFGLSSLIAAVRLVWFMARGEVSRKALGDYAKVNLVIYIMLWLMSLWVFVVKPYSWFSVGGTQSAF